MQIGLIGLGKMGYNLALNMKDKGHEVVAFTRSAEKLDRIKGEGVKVVYDLNSLVKSLKGRRIVWIMVPAGETVDVLVEELKKHLDAGDILIDGGNSHYRDSVRRAEELSKLGIEYLDVGTSGGLTGARNGICAMVGGRVEAFEAVEPLFGDISVEKGYAYMGRSGSGHFVKMVHNGIEYGMMQAIGEGFELLQASNFDVELEKVAGVWSNGSIIRGWLMELAENLFREKGNLGEIQDIIDASGEGLWTVEEALKIGVPVPAIAESLFVRFRSKQDESFTGKVVAGLRNQFGGHALHIGK